MIHSKRRFQIANIDDAADFAAKLTEHTWTLCTGFRFRGLLFLNDSISEDGAGEWAVFTSVFMENHLTRYLQIESITFGWMNALQAQGFIVRLASGALRTEMGKPIEIRTHVSGESCRLCA